MSDQAQSLRKLVSGQAAAQAGRSTKVVTVTSGKGGVGKSNFSLNFALALQKMGLKALVFDADIGMANIDVLMGQSVPYNLYHLLKQEKTIWDIIAEGPHGLHFIAGGSGFKDLLQLSAQDLHHFSTQISMLQGHYDVLLFDTGAGLSKETVQFISAAEQTIVVTTPEPTSITDAYALIKMVTAMGHKVDFSLIVNRAADAKEGRQTAEKIGLVAKQFLQADIPALGIIPDDANVPKAVKRQVPFSLAYPNSDASRSVQEIAARFAQVQPPGNHAATGGVRGFLQRILSFKR